MKPKDRGKRLSVFSTLLISFMILTIGNVSVGLCNDETSVDVKFEILTGSGIESYYSGDHFWYNITMTNNGTTIINATFTVTVRNTTGGIIGAVQSYERYLEPTETTTIFPNYTRLEKDEIYVYFMDIAGAYSITLTSDVPMTFYRYYETGRYTVEHDKCHINIDVMPSYQKPQNERWNEFLQKNEEYMNQVEQYIQESKIASQKTRILTYFTIIIALLSSLLSIGSIQFSWLKIPKKIQEKNRLLYWVLTILIAIFIVLIAYTYFTVIIWI